MLKKTFSIVVILVLSACAAYQGFGLKPGISTESEVRSIMGTPAMVFPESNGESRFIYPRGPMGLETYVARVDKGGRLVAIDQVLEEKYFSLIRAGMTEEDVMRLIGTPYITIPFPRRSEIAWDYRYRDLWGYIAIFSVIFDESKQVKTMVRTREETNSRWGL